MTDPNLLRATYTVPDFRRCARMSWGFLSLAAFVCALTIAGCASWRGTEPHVENKFVAYYDRLAQEIAAPDPTIRSQVLLPPWEKDAVLPPPISKTAGH